MTGGHRLLSFVTCAKNKQIFFPLDIWDESGIIYETRQVYIQHFITTCQF